MTSFRSVHILIIAVAVLCAFGLSACAELDPATQAGAWQVTRANAANLRAMVAVPADLAFGVAAPASDGHRAARAMERLRTDRVYPLPDSAVSKVGGSAAPVSPPSAVE